MSVAEGTLLGPCALKPGQNGYFPRCINVVSDSDELARRRRSWNGGQAYHRGVEWKRRCYPHGLRTWPSRMPVHFTAEPVSVAVEQLS